MKAKCCKLCGRRFFSQSGRHIYCPPCAKERRRDSQNDWRKSHPDYQKKWREKYFLETKERYDDSEKTRRWLKRHPKYFQKWLKKHPEYFSKYYSVHKTYWREWRKKNRERYNEYKRKYMRK
ncbi:MAG: hypothetical protein AB1393_04640, partial [Candidatus Edwardsbacteria bacterium]